MKIVILLLSVVATINCDQFKTVFSWKQVDYDFLNDSMRESYKSSGNFIQENNVPLGLNVWEDKLFITVPRWKKGVPANLNYISLSKSASNNFYFFIYISTERRQ